MSRIQRIGYSRKVYPRPLFEAIAASQLYNDDLLWVMFTYKQAKYGHRNQTRLDMARYFDHPKSMALIIMLEFNIFLPLPLKLALLHDVKEGSFIYTWWEIEKVYGKDVYRGLRIVTKEDAKDYFRGIIESDWWIILVKLADRLHNLRTLRQMKTDFIIRQIEETRREYPAVIEALRRKIPKRFSHVPDYIEAEFAYAIKKAERVLKNRAN